jgi:hypothetical protein
MKNVPTKKRELAPALTARVDACACIFIADKPEKIHAIMADRNVSELEAGRIYTIGALKAAKRRGIARNYREALELLESEQVGDRGNPLNRFISADNMARVVDRYRRMNANAPMRVNKVDVVRMAWARMDNQPYTAYIQPYNWRVEAAEPKEEKVSRSRNMYKILGSMYTDMVYKQERLDPVYDAYDARMHKNLKAFFTEYVSRLSRTVRMRLMDLAEYIDRESNGDALKAERIISALTSAQGREAPETGKMASLAARLHLNFAYKDSVTCPELVSMLFRYGDIG